MKNIYLIQKSLIFSVYNIVIIAVHCSLLINVHLKIAEKYNILILQ